MHGADTRETDTAASSLASPNTSGSTYVPSPSTAAQPSVNKEALTSKATDGDGVTSLLKTTSGPQTALPEGQIVPEIPLRSSSNPGLQSSSTSPTSGQASGDQANTSQTKSKGSVKAGSRSGSVASSKHSKRVVRIFPEASNNVTAAANTPTAPAAVKPKKRGPLKFLSLLNCCAAPENANTVEPGNQAVPAKKVKVLQPTRSKQATPVVKQSPSAAESSTGESKEPADENIGGPPYSELPPAAQPPKMLPPRSKETTSAEKTALPDNSGRTLDEKEDLADSGTRNQPLPPLPPTNNPTDPDGHTEQIQPIIPSTGGNTAPVDSSATPSSDDVAAKDSAVDNRTPGQETKDSDVPMVDAPPIVTPPEEKSKNPEERDESHPQINLPPPPPRNGQDRTAGGIGRSPSNAATPNEKQQWLLPPLQPRFRGKKCLVLDLDETLVHSSFKVYLMAVSMFVF